VYFDSSALVKRYINEPGSNEVLDWCDQATELALSIVAVPELVSAFRRLVRERRLTGAQYRKLKGELMVDIADILICDTSAHVVQRAIDALERAPLRALDAIHLGAALVCGADVFISADARQCEVARQFDLKVIQL
jgi:hypothetical protein